MTHSKAGPSPQSQAAVAAEVMAVVDAADAEDEEEEVVTLEEDTVEELPTVENTCVEVKEAILWKISLNMVIVYIKDQGPAQFYLLTL